MGPVTLGLDADVVAIQPVIESTFQSWRGVIGRHLPIHDPSRRESLAGLILSTIEGAYIRGRAERTKQPSLTRENGLSGLFNSLSNGMRIAQSVFPGSLRTAEIKSVADIGLCGAYASS